MAEEVLERLRQTLARRYAVEREVGRGGMATVYLAQDLKHHRSVALKVLHPEVAGNLGSDRFLREIEIAARLQHPHILPLYDSGRAGRLLYYVMPFVEGESLRDRLDREKTLPLEEALRITREVARALEYAHAHGVVHRDIKPANILLSGGQAVVTDFGVAHALQSAGGKTLTQTGYVVGTPAYMSPEQMTLGTEPDGRSDQYSLACVLYEMLSGEPPSASAFTEVVFDPEGRKRAATAVARASIPAAVAEALRRAMARSPADRFATVTEFAEALAPPASGVWIEPPRPERAARVWAAVWVVGGLAVLTAIAAAWNPGGWRQRVFGSLGARRIQSLAVLPLRNLSGRSEQDYFADGMTEVLTTDLSKIASLKVISSTSAMAYKGQNKKLPDIARELDVDAVVEGSVVLAGDSVRITAQLVDARADRHLWSEQYDRDARDVLRLQSEVARAVAREVEARLSPEETARLARAPTADPRVSENYLKGRFYWNRRTEEGFRQAAVYFQRAIDLDSSYALAYAGLADAYIGLGSYGFLEPKDAYPVAKAAAQYALTLDDQLAEAYTSLAWIEDSYDWDWTSAEEDFRKALHSNPGYATAHHWYALHLSRLGRHDQARAEIARARELDPLSFNVATGAGIVAYNARDQRAAVRWLQQALELEPDFAAARYQLMLALAQERRFPEARAQAESLSAVTGIALERRANLAYLDALSGNVARARATLPELRSAAERGLLPHVNLASIYSALGDVDPAIAELEKSLADHDDAVTWLGVDPVWDGVRKSARFQALVRRVGLPAV